MFGRIVEFDGVAAGDQVDVGSGFLQEAGEIARGGASPDDGYGAAAELAEFGVLRAVGDEVWRQVGEDGRDVFEVRDADGDDDTTGEEALSCLRGEGEAFGRMRDGGDVGLFEVGGEALLEGHAVGDEGFDGDGIDDVGVGQRLLAAEVLEGECGAGVVEAGGEAVGFEQGAGSHAVSPTGHGRAEDAEGDVASA